MVKVLTKRVTLCYLEGPCPLVTGMADPEKEMQSNGIDFTLRQVRRLQTPRRADSRKRRAGCLDFTNEHRRLAKTSELPFDSKGWLYVAHGCYEVVFNEAVDIPHDMLAIGRPRSSLLRNAATVDTGVWDSGYTSRSEALLLVFNASGLRLGVNARHSTGDLLSPARAARRH